MPTRVLNMRDAPRGWDKDPVHFAYIGRPGKGYTERTAPFGKPREYDKLPDWPEKYRAYLNRKLQTDFDFMWSVKALKGMALVCFCKPKPCHGDILMRAVDWLNSPEGREWWLPRVHAHNEAAIDNMCCPYQGTCNCND